MDSPRLVPNRVGQRIAIVGTTGSGKTTLAKHLAGLLDIPHIELDALHWGPNWTGATRDIFRERLLEVTNAETWVTDGNYSEARDIVWGRADTLIWLDYSLTVILTRLVQRTLRRVVTHEELWNGNRKTFRGAFLSRDSLFLWALKTYPRRWTKYPALLANPGYQHLTAIRLSSPRRTDLWLAEVEVFVRLRAYTSPN